MRRPSIKSAISTLSVLSLLFILLLFTVFVYFFLSNWLVSREQTSILEQAKQISLAYPNNIQEGQDQQIAQWLQPYLVKEQWVKIVNLKGVSILSYTLPHQPTLVLQTLPLQIGTSIKLMQDHRFIRAVYPIYDGDGHTLAWVILYSSVDTIFSLINTLIRTLLIGSLGAIVLAGISGYVVSWIAIGPLDRIIRLIRKIEPNRLSYRLPAVRGAREIGELTETFNTMLERIEHTMNAQNRFIEDASHELRSPITVIEGYVNLLDRWGKGNEAITERALQAIKKESSRLRHLTNDLLQLASLQEIPIPIPRIEVAPLLKELVTNIQVAYHRSVVCIGCEEVGAIAMHPEHLQQLLMILLDNAVKYTEKEKRIFVFLAVGTAFVRITVEDEGQGIAEETLPHIFDRFYREDASRDRKKGAGLGLAIAKGLVDLYKGSLEVTSILGQGTAITVQFSRYYMGK